jgi:hypothetical protein
VLRSNMTVTHLQCRSPAAAAAAAALPCQTTAWRHPQPLLHQTQRHLLLQAALLLLPHRVPAAETV